MATRETREIATYLRNGTLWVGQFVIERDDLDFGDDRRNAAQGLARYVRAVPARSADWVQARMRTGAPGHWEKRAALQEMRAAIERLKLAA